MKKLYALRGAVQCENNADDICAQIGLMYDELLSRNNLDENDIVSIIFSVTKDLDAVNPATALRKYIRESAKSRDREGGEAGSEYSLFSAQEPDCVNSVERIIRVIVHCYMEEETKPKHVYRNGAEVLRPDRVK